MFSDPATVASTAFAFRIGERIALTVVVILVALVVTAGFWRSIQKVDFTLSKAGTSGGGTLVLATPVFALLALIGLAWVSFAHPITVSVPAAVPAAAPPAPGGPAEPAQVAGNVTMAGALPVAQADVEFARNTARMRILSLNCLAQAAGDGVSEREADALAAVKASLMRAVWDPAWGDAAAFEAWATGLPAGPPADDARAVFTAVHPLC
jgi:hypothetical protein